MSKGTLNKVQLIGRLGRDPELKYTANGQAIATLNIATNESYKDKDGKPVELTDWHRVIAWRKLAEICGQYLKKGSLVYIEGKLKTRSFDDKQGQKKFVTEIVADTMQMLGGRAQEGGDYVPPPPSGEMDTPSATANTPPSPSDASADDDLPF